ncbi:MAG: alpha-ketoglutarate-dependent dioxygenase AlkB [Actinomycetota bacterium]|nr:alpha-ketoglutarate-dependent dioxygenase AlkB [Actinomycetota bacterium]
MLQGTLFGNLPFHLGDLVTTVQRIRLDDDCWVDHSPGWIQGADDLYATFRDSLAWRSHRRWIVDREVVEPRLSTGIAKPSVALREIGHRLTGYYGIGLVPSWANFYRDGCDSVAWHGDRFRPGAVHETVALVSFGGPRTLRIRPRGGGPSWSWNLASGDLLVMGGLTQHRFEHCIPKATKAGGRVSVAYRCPRGREYDPTVVRQHGRNHLRLSRL